MRGQPVPGLGVVRLEHGVVAAGPVARGRRAGRPASSKHSRRAATQKASPPDPTPNMALASASLRRAQASSAAGVRSSSSTFPPGKT